MTRRLALAVTCHDPRGSFASGAHSAAAVLRRTFDALAVNATAETSPATIAALEAVMSDVVVELHAAGSIDVGTARLQAVEIALQQGCSHVLYSDVDHVLRWASTAPDELATVMDTACGSDAGMTVIGRSPEAFAREPARLQMTEGAVNRAVSLAFGVEDSWDFMMAIRLLPRATAEFLVDRCREPSIANDVVWPLSVQRAGLVVAYQPAHGLAYRYRDDYGTATDTRDDNPREWIKRIQIAAQHAGALQSHLG